jgi:hypothetical protein
MQDAAGRTQLLEDWRKTVAQEARNRGVDDVFKTGRWTTPILDNGAPSSPQAPRRSRQAEQKRKNAAAAAFLGRLRTADQRLNPALA